MITKKREVPLPDAPAAPAREFGDDYRARLAAEQTRTAEERKLALAEQYSHENTPEQRIRVWERLHALSLPLDPAHPLLDLIAKATRLTREQLRDEQRRRAAAVANDKQPKRKAFDPYCVLRK